MRVLNDSIRPPRTLDKSIEPELELICMKCLERDPQARYNSAASLANDLRNWLDGEPISVKPPTMFALMLRECDAIKGSSMQFSLH